jgi:hypothetical protein
MKKVFFYIFIIYLLLPATTKAQFFSIANNQPSVSSSRTRIPEGPSVYGVFVGRTACQELITELSMPKSEECAKRKMGFTLYQDPVTHEPTTYELRGLGKWSGTGKWRIVRGTASNPDATVFQLLLDANTSLNLLKEDDNVLFVLDRSKAFLVGNAKYSYTMNRAKN